MSRPPEKKIRATKAARPFIGMQIREFRIARSLTQVELGELIGTSGNVVASWELGNADPSRPTRALFRILFAEPEAAFRALAHDFEGIIAVA